MDDPIMIEPDGPHRPAFAAWCLAQDPPVQTASSTGFLVPVDLYPSVPSELLEGAYIDGYPYGGPPVPAEAQQAASGPLKPATGREADAIQDVAEGVPSATPIDPLAALKDLAGELPAASDPPVSRPRAASGAKRAGA